MPWGKGKKRGGGGRGEWRSDPGTVGRGGSGGGIQGKGLMCKKAAGTESLHPPRLAPHSPSLSGTATPCTHPATHPTHPRTSAHFDAR